MNKDGSYKFKAVKGNTDVSVGDVKGVKVLWETFGTDTAPNVGDLIKADVSYADGYITFNTNDTYHKGNAVIAAYSDTGCTEGIVLCSWHIWLTEQPAEQKYVNINKQYAGTLMDRNLGATSGTPGEVEFLGLLYQWGRKDPFPGSYKLHSSEYDAPLAKSTINWPSPEETDATKGTVDYVTKHPTTFLTSSQSPWDWAIPQNDNLWSSEKTQYDPCPPGWKVPNPSVWEYFTSDAGRGSTDYDESSRTHRLSDGYFPNAGNYQGTGVRDLGTNGYYWTCNDQQRVNNCIWFLPSGGPGELTHFSIEYHNRRKGYSVRCQKIE